MKTGRSLREMGESKTGEFGNVLETVDYARDFERLPAVLASALQKHASVMKYVSRAMRAADAVLFYHNERDVSITRDQFGVANERRAWFHMPGSRGYRLPAGTEK